MIDEQTTSSRTIERLGNHDILRFEYNAILHDGGGLPPLIYSL